MIEGEWRKEDSDEFEKKFKGILEKIEDDLIKILKLEWKEGKGKIVNEGNIESWMKFWSKKMKKIKKGCERS